MSLMINHSALLTWIFAGGCTSHSGLFAVSSLSLMRTMHTSLGLVPIHINSFQYRWALEHVPPHCVIFRSHSCFSHCTWALSIPCGWPSSREAHFLILELPESQRVTGPNRPTRARQTQPSSCLQEADSKAFVFGFYKRKFCRGLPERN